MKVSDYFIDYLASQGIDQVFSYIGKNAHLCDSIDKYNKIENVFTVHEQGAGFAADGYARVTDKIGVATVTSGPGATNLVTSIADCYYDSIPSLFIVGDVPPDECKGSRDIRAFGFQETDIVAIAEPITKYAVQVNDLKHLRYELEKSCFLAQAGRKGPVLFSLPENLQFISDFEPESEASFFDSEEYKHSQNKIAERADFDLDETVSFINQAKRPVVLVGGGIRLANAAPELRSFLQKTQIPIVYSLMGKDAVSDEYPHNLGFLGNFGTRYANLTIANADLLIVLGSRLDNLQTGRKIETFAREAKTIQVDIDSNELGIRKEMDLLINADLKTFLQKLNQHSFNLNIAIWQERVQSYKERYPVEYDSDGQERLGNQLIAQISGHLKDDDIICVDVGEHQMLVAQSLRTKDKQRVLFSGGFGAMGFALPAAIGATLATGKRVIVISGDGGFQMNIQELEMIKRRNLPIKMFIINNESLHMVKLRQDTYLNANHVGSKRDYSVPHFKKVAKAFGIKAYKVAAQEKMEKVLRKSLKGNKPVLVDFLIDAHLTTVEPRLDFTRSFEDMRPYLSRKELEEQMLIKLVK